MKIRGTYGPQVKMLLREPCTPSRLLSSTRPTPAETRLRFRILRERPPAALWETRIFRMDSTILPTPNEEWHSSSAVLQFKISPLNFNHSGDRLRGNCASRKSFPSGGCRSTQSKRLRKCLSGAASRALQRQRGRGQGTFQRYCCRRSS